MKARSSSVKLDTLRSLKTALVNDLVASGEKPTAEVADENFLNILQRSIKQRKDSIAQFEIANRSDLKEREVAELEVLNQYLPTQLSEDEIVEIISKHKDKLGSSTIKDMGPLMKSVLSEVGMSADRGFVSEKIKGILS